MLLVIIHFNGRFLLDLKMFNVVNYYKYSVMIILNVHDEPVQIIFVSSLLFVGIVL